MKRPVVFTALAIALAAPDFAHADEADVDDGRTIIVTGRSDGYRPLETTTATKTPTPLIDVPQSVSVVTRDLIEDQALRSIGDVLRYVPGTTVGQGEGNRDQVTLRGTNTTADFFVDGVRDDVQYFRGLYNVERVEVLKGPNAMIFGRGGGGGIINRVSKAPTDTALIGGSIGADSFGAFVGEVDINQPLGAGAAFRVNAVYEHGERHRDFYEFDRHAINPAVAFTLGEATRIGLSYEYVDDERVTDRGIPSFAGAPIAGFRDLFVGVPGINQTGFKAHVLKGQAEHQLSDALTLRGKLSYGDYDKFYRNAFAATPVAVVAGVQQVGIEAYFDPTERKNLFGQLDLVGEFDTGGVGHVVLAGVDYGDQQTRNQRINGFFDSDVATTSSGRRTVVTFADPIVIPPITFRAGAGNRSITSDAEFIGVFLQDQVAIGETVEIVAGLRYDRFDVTVRDLVGATSLTRQDDLWSPRLGLIFKPVPHASIYASYGRSYLPSSGDQFLSLDLTGAALKPERFDNYELGVKWDITPALNLTAAIYRLDRTNTRAPGATLGTTVLTGEQRSKGLEVGLTGRIMPQWQVSAGYTLQDAEVRRTTSAAPASRKTAQVPRHIATLWNRYDLSDRFGIGLGVYRQSKNFASISNAVVLPAYTRVDAAVFFRISEALEAQVNIENLLDETHFPTAHNDNNISTGVPIAGRFTLRARF